MPLGGEPAGAGPDVGVQLGHPDSAAVAEGVGYLVVALDRADQLLVDAAEEGGPGFGGQGGHVLGGKGVALLGFVVAQVPGGEHAAEPLPHVPLGQPGPTLNREDDFWLIGYGDGRARVPDSLGLRYLDLLVRNPGRELAAVELARLAAATGPAATAACADGLHDSSGAPADDILDQQARTAYRQRLTGFDEELAEAEAWRDTERASRLRAEKDFLVRELTAATGLGGRPRQLGSESERARLNVTRAIRTAISRVRDRAPEAAARLDQAIRTGTRCSYSPPSRPS